VIDAVTGAVFQATTASPYEAEIKRALERLVAERLMDLAGRARMPQVRAVATQRLVRLTQRLDTSMGAPDEATLAHRALLVRDVKRFLDRPASPAQPVAPPQPPPGAPIGDPGMDWLQRLAPLCSGEIR
jgi:hypothetical protein